ncbi:MAG: flagellar hook-associated protein 3 [Gammaproteobacteria bacterium]|nr:flagellar hook-associated protein 3 [Gammaproteobacteria bacterium]
MRVSTSLFHSMGLQSIQKHQEDVLDLQVKLSTGKRVNAPGDDPVALNQIHSLNRTMSTLDQYAKNGEFAKAQLMQEETSIEDSIVQLQRARELAVQMSSGTYGPTDRQAASAELEQIIQQTKNMMNYRNSEGELIFAGSSSRAEQAFVEDVNNPGYYAYIGSVNAIGQVESDGTTPVYDPLAEYGARFIQVGFDADNKLSADDGGDSSRIRLSDNGAKVFNITATTAFTGTPDSNVLNVLVELNNALKAGSPPPAGVLDDLESGVNQLSQVRAEIGGRQNRIEAQYDAGESFKIALEERRMGLEDMDIVQGVTDLTQSQNALQLAQQVFSRVQSMSLFDYLR